MIPRTSMDDERTALFVQSCREQGLKVTHQRMQIFLEITRVDSHPDAEAVFARVRRRIPTISLDTVYRTLRMFETHGLISHVGSTGGRMRFDARTDHHHHFVCSRCGLIRDVSSDTLDRVAAPPGTEALGRVDSVYVELRGLCAACQSRSGTA